MRYHFRDWLIGLPRKNKQVVMVLGDVVGLAICIALVKWIALPAISGSTVLAVAMATIAISIAATVSAGFYRSIVRYLGIGLVWASVRITALSSLVLAGSALGLGLTDRPIQLAIIHGAFVLIYLTGSRYLAQHFLIYRSRGKESVILYGAGEASAQTALALQNGDTFLPVALIDDDQSLQGRIVSGLRVYGRNDIDSLIDEFHVSRILLAMPGISRRSRQEIIRWLEPRQICVQTIPALDDLVTGRARVDDICDVDVADLLGREVVPPVDELLEATITGKSVMVTGAGGSIGSGLCRQIVRLHPKRIVLFELSEVSLYAIERELRSLVTETDANCDILALLGSVQNYSRVLEVMEAFCVQTIYHAAAYKHVPLVEQNLLEGVSNNVFGTLHTARAAEAANVETFVLVSTDKAVLPANIMGATKRISEIILQAMQDGGSRVRYCMVRFGNVLASSGSVVPLFREQIRAGGPVTVTHPEIIRYFMTIPEAAQLVIQAASMAKGGDVFVLDMGAPVRIKDLARRMIKLMGLTVRNSGNPDGDIEIVYTGLRPAEKLYEELLLGTDVSGTAHPQIMRANEEYLPLEELAGMLKELETAVSDGDRERSRALLMRCVAGYAPCNGIDDLVWEGRQGRRGQAQGSKVVSIEERRRISPAGQRD